MLFCLFSFLQRDDSITLHKNSSQVVVFVIRLFPSKCTVIFTTVFGGHLGVIKQDSGTVTHRIESFLIPCVSSVLVGHLGAIKEDGGNANHRIEGALIFVASNVIGGHQQAIT